MPLQTNPFQSSEGQVTKTQNGINYFPRGSFYLQTAASASYNTSVVETSLLKASAQAQGISGNIFVPSTALPVLPANWAALGTLITGRLAGTIANTGTPAIRVRVVLKNSAGTVIYTLADSASLAMTSTTAVDWVINFESMVRVVGASGQFGSRIDHRYATTVVPTAYANVTVDTTVAYSLDVLATWDASSASNIALIQWANFEVI